MEYTMAIVTFLEKRYQSGAGNVTLKADHLSNSVSLKDQGDNRSRCTILTVAILTCAWVKRTRRFRRWASGNCIGFVSVTLHAARLPMLDMAWPMLPPAEPPISRETAKKMRR